MARSNSVGVRLKLNVKNALERAAQADDRSLSGLIGKIVEEWAVRERWLTLDRPPLPEQKESDNEGQRRC